MVVHRPVAFFATLIIGLVLTVSLCVTVGTPASSEEVPQSAGHGKVVAWFYPEMNKKATLINRSIDCEAGMVIYTANSHTYGFAVATAVVPIKDTLLLYKEVCDGPQANK